MFIKIIVVVVVSCVMTHGISAGYPGFFGYQQPSQGFFPPAPVFYQPRPALRYDVGLGQAPTPPQHYYSPPKNTYRGFSYETRYQDGASSHVVYVTGPQSQELMQRSVAVFRNVLPVAPPSPVQPTLPTVVEPTSNSSSPPDVGRFAPRVSSQPRQFTPVFNLPQFISPPFPYRSFASPFFNAIPPQLQVNNLASDPSQSNVEPAIEVQESMIREVAVPEIISNRIGDSQDAGTVSAPAVVTGSASTASTQASIEAASSVDPIVVTEAQTESSSLAAVPVDVPTTAATPVALAPADSPTPTDAPANTPAPADAPANTPAPAETPADSPSPAETPADSPSPAETPADSPAPADAPADSPAPAETPADSPAPADAPADSPAPAVTPADSPAPAETPADSPAPAVTPADSPSPAVTPADSPATPDTTSAETSQVTGVTTSAPSGQEDSAPAGEVTAQSETVTEEQVSQMQTEAAPE